MPIRPKLVHCKFCNQPFQTFDEDKKYCNDQCRARETILTSRTAMEDSKGRKSVPITDEDKWYRCHYCGTNIRKKKRAGAVSSTMYCDAICQMAKKIHKTQMAKPKTCRECGIDFMPSQYSRVMCSESCRKIERKRKGQEYFQSLETPAKDPSEKHKNRVSYDELNRRSEVKRLNEDWKRLSKWK